jgi:hypothetical protein
MASNLVYQGIEALKSGDKVKAYQLISAAVRQNPNDELAWLVLSEVVSKPEYKLDCLQRVVMLNPENLEAKRKLKQLKDSKSKPGVDSFSIQPPKRNKASSSQNPKSPVIRRRNRLFLKPFLIGVGIFAVICSLVVVVGILIYPTIIQNPQFLISRIVPAQSPSPTITSYTITNEGDQQGSTVILTANGEYQIVPVSNEVIITSEQIVLNIPPDALAQGAQIKIQPVVAPPAPSNSTNVVPVGTAVQIETNTETLNGPLEIEIPYKRADLPQGIMESSLQAEQWDGKNWELLDSRVENSRQVVRARITHFSAPTIQLWGWSIGGDSVVAQSRKAADNAFDRGDYASAVEKYAQIVKQYMNPQYLDPTSPTVLNKLDQTYVYGACSRWGESYYMMGDADHYVQAGLIFSGCVETNLERLKYELREGTCPTEQQICHAYIALENRYPLGTMTTRQLVNEPWFPKSDWNALTYEYSGAYIVIPIDWQNLPQGIRDRLESDIDAITGTISNQRTVTSKYVEALIIPPRLQHKFALAILISDLGNSTKSIKFMKDLIGAIKGDGGDLLSIYGELMSYPPVNTTTVMSEDVRGVYDAWETRLNTDPQVKNRKQAGELFTIAGAFVKDASGFGLWVLDQVVNGVLTDGATLFQGELGDFINNNDTNSYQYYGLNPPTNSAFNYSPLILFRLQREVMSDDAMYVSQRLMGLVPDWSQSSQKLGFGDPIVYSSTPENTIRLFSSPEVSDSRRVWVDFGVNNIVIPGDYAALRSNYVIPIKPLKFEFTLDKLSKDPSHEESQDVLNQNGQTVARIVLRSLAEYPSNASSTPQIGAIGLAIYKPTETALPVACRVFVASEDPLYQVWPHNAVGDEGQMRANSIMLSYQNQLSVGDAILLNAQKGIQPVFTYISVVVDMSGMVGGENGDCSFFDQKVTLISAQQISAQLTIDNLKNMEYHINDNQDVLLSNGEYKQTGPIPVNVNFYLPPVFGSIQSDISSDAVVILHVNVGGSGSFHILAVVVQQNNVPVNIASTDLGMSIIINSIQIQNKQINIDMLVQGPNDPNCCPTLKEVWKFILNNNKLERIDQH